MLSDTFGPGDSRPKLLNLMRSAASTGKLLEMSPGEQLVDLVYIDDVIEAFKLAADRMLPDGMAARHEHYSVCSGTPIRVRALVPLVGKSLGVELPVKLGARPYRPREVMVPSCNAPCLPGWTPRTALAEGLRKWAASSP